MALAVLAEGPGFGFQLIDGAVETGQPVAARIIPDRRQKVAGGKQRPRRRGAASARRQGDFVLRQAPAGIKGLAEQARPVARQDRLVPQLRADRINGMGVFQQPPGRDFPVAEDVPGPQIVRAKMAGAQATDRLGVAAQKDGTAGMLAPRRVQHGQEPIPSCAHQRGVAPCLVDHHDIAGIGTGKIGPVSVVFRQIQRPQPRDPLAGALLMAGRRALGDKPFDQRRAGRVEMQAEGVDQQPQRTAPGDAPPGAAGKNGAQKGILDRDQPRAAARGDGPAAPSRGAGAPDAHGIPRPGQPEAQIPSRQLQDAAQAGAVPEAAAVCEKPPVLLSGGLLPGRHPPLTA